MSKEAKTMVTASEIARSIKMNPRAARRKLRAGWKGHRHGTDWKFPIARRSEVAKFLKG
jgi:hypothetical protein